MKREAERPLRAILAGQLIDGTRASPITDAVVVIEKERIAAVGRRHDVPLAPEAEVIDASHGTVMPGLIDVHVHVHTPGGPITNYALSEGRELQGTLALRALAYVLRDLAMGYTTLRSLGSPGYIDVALRSAIEEGTVRGPRLLVAGQGLILQRHMRRNGQVAPVLLPGKLRNPLQKRAQFAQLW